MSTEIRNNPVFVPSPVLTLILPTLNIEKCSNERKGLKMAVMRMYPFIFLFISFLFVFYTKELFKVLLLGFFAIVNFIF